MNPRTFPPRFDNTHLPEGDEAKMMLGDDDASYPLPAHPNPPSRGAADTKHQPLPVKPKGLVLLDWDGTVVTSADECIFINGKRTTELLTKALARGIDVRIVTARPEKIEPVYSEKYTDTYVNLLGKLKNLGLVNTVHNETFWRSRIHCVLKDIADWKAVSVMSDAPRCLEIAKRKKICVEGILKQPQYLGLTQARFYDDDRTNCYYVGAIPNVVAIPAYADGTHFDNLDEFVCFTPPPTQSRPAEAKREALVTIPLNETSEQRFFEKLNNCLDAMYPYRSQWGGKAITNASGIKDIHRFIFNKKDKFDYSDIHDVYAIAKKRLEKGCCACWPTLFGGRAPHVQKLYSILEDLGGRENRSIIPLQNLAVVNRRLDEFTNELQAQRAPAPVAAPTIEMPAIR